MGRRQWGHDSYSKHTVTHSYAGQNSNGNGEAWKSRCLLLPPEFTPPPPRPSKKKKAGGLGEGVKALQCVTQHQSAKAGLGASD